jgi:hypothetical protein
MYNSIYLSNIKDVVILNNTRRISKPHNLWWIEYPRTIDEILPSTNEINTVIDEILEPLLL